MVSNKNITMSLDEYISNLLINSPNYVKSICIGKKIIRNTPIDYNAIVFYVENKKDLKDLPNNEIIPKSIQIDNIIYPTDVVEIKT